MLSAERGGAPPGTGRRRYSRLLVPGLRHRFILAQEGGAFTKEIVCQKQRGTVCQYLVLVAVLVLAW